MPVKEIEVRAHSGYKGEEYPGEFAIDDQRIEVIEVLKMWIEEEIGCAARKRFFKVQGNDGYTYTVYRDENTGTWYLS